MRQVVLFYKSPEKFFQTCLFHTQRYLSSSALWRALSRCLPSSMPPRKRCRPSSTPMKRARLLCCTKLLQEISSVQERELKPLAEIVDLIRIGPFGSALHKEDYIQDGIPVVNPQHIVNQVICPDSRKSISESKAGSHRRHEAVNSREGVLRGTGGGGVKTCAKAGVRHGLHGGAYQSASRLAVSALCLIPCWLRRR